MELLLSDVLVYKITKLDYDLGVLLDMMDPNNQWMWFTYDYYIMVGWTLIAVA